MLAGLVKDCRPFRAIDWRLNVSAELEKTRCAVTERRLSAGILRSKDWAEGEPDIAVIEVALSIDQHRLKLRTRCLCTLSMHAISRRVQRHSDASETAILCDIAIAAEAAAGVLQPGVGYKIMTDPETGSGWRGRAVQQRQPDGETYPVLSIRTWISDG